MTVIEMVIALTIISTSFLALSFVLFGALDAYAAARTRSAFVEIGNAELEEMRSLPYSDVGVRTDGSDPTYSTAPTGSYPGGQFEGRDAVSVTATVAPRAVSEVTSSPINNLPLPYTVRRWITWTDASGGTAHIFKKLAVRIEWREENATRSFRLTSLLYAGGIGPPVTNPPPVAALTASQTQTTVGSSISFDASGSSDPGGEPLTYQWDFGDGTSFIGSTTQSHSYSTPGRYTAKITVVDPHGGFDSEIVDLVIGTSSGNFPPDAQFTYTPTTGNAPLTVSFDAGTSTDPNGPSDIVSYSWNWGDGTPNGSGVNVGHSFATANTYLVVLTVTDSGGLSDTSSGVVLVTSLTCEVSSGHFVNPDPPSESPVNPRNDIVVESIGNNKPVEKLFKFYATTNTACTQVIGRIDKHDGSFFEVTLVEISTSGTTKSWAGSRTADGNDKFNLGTETGEIRASGVSGSVNVFTFAYIVHT